MFYTSMWGSLRLGPIIEALGHDGKGFQDSFHDVNAMTNLNPESDHCSMRYGIVIHMF